LWLGIVSLFSTGGRLMNRLCLFLLIFTLFFFGCAGDEDVDKPGVDSQVLFQTSLDMEKWFVNVRFVEHFCIEASQAIAERLAMRQTHDSDLDLESIVNHFKSPNGLIDRLNEYLKNMQREKSRLDAIRDKDIRIFDNLKICNTLLERYITLISTVPATQESFLEQRDNIQKQLSSIIRLLEIEYPLSSDELGALTTMSNASYRSLIQQIRSAPVSTQEDSEEPDDVVIVPTPTPTVPPLVTWRTQEGFIHMGYDPPDGVDILHTQTQVSEPEESIVSTPLPDDPSGEPQTYIWVDSDGVTHMGHEVPEGYESRPARDIPLMIGE
jgi:hypothetical protein